MKKKLVALVGVLLIIVSSMSMCFGDEDKDDKKKKNLVLTIGDMEFGEAINLGEGNSIWAEDGMKLFKVKVTVKNVDDDKHTISPVDFSLEDTNGNSYTALKEKYEFEEGQIEERKLSANEAITGIMIFELPESATPSKLLCSPEWSLEVVATINPEDLLPDYSPLSMSANKADKNIYYSIDIVKISGGSLNIANAKFLIITSSGVQLINRAYTDASPSSLTQGDTTVYPIPSSLSPVYENSSTGDGATVDTDTINYPLRWEGCYLAFIDSESDGKVNAGDAIWIYKDYNDDGTNEISSGYKIKILDNNDYEILVKEV